MRADVSPARTALLLIDWQVDFASPDGAMALQGRDLAAVPGALAEATVLLNAARATGVLPVFVRLHSADLCTPGTRGAEFFGIAPRPDDLVVTKPLYSAFAGTGLAASLKDRGIGTLVLSGLTSECCVAATAWAAFEEGFELVIAANACAAYEPALHDNALRALALSGAELAAASDIMARFS